MFDLQFEGGVLGALSNFVSLLERLQRGAEAGELRIDVADAQLHVSGHLALVALAEERVARVRHGALQRTQPFVRARQVEVGLGPEAGAVRLLRYSQLPVSKFQTLSANRSLHH